MRYAIRPVLLLALALSGCGPAPAATDPSPPDADAGAEAKALPTEMGIYVDQDEYMVNITSVPPDPKTELVTYFILRPDNKDKNFVLQLSSTGYPDRFPIALSRKKFYRGTYEIRAHMGSELTPFKTIEFELNGVSISDDLADSLQR